MAETAAPVVILKPVVELVALVPRLRLYGPDWTRAAAAGMEAIGIIGTGSGSASLDDASHVLPLLDAFAGRKWRSPGFEHGQGFSLDTRGQCALEKSARSSPLAACSW